MNNNDYKGLNNYVNNLADAQVKSIYGNDSIFSADYNNGKKRVEEIISLIDNNRNLVGAFDGRKSDLIQKFA